MIDAEAGIGRGCGCFEGVLVGIHGLLEGDAEKESMQLCSRACAMRDFAVIVSNMPISEAIKEECPECGFVMDVTECDPFEEIACPECAANVRVRRVFDHYRIEGELGVGGMSRVYRARDQHLERLVALKVLNRDNSFKKDRIIQFEREARLTASINHPHVVRVYGVGRENGYLYIAMELVHGRNLEEHMEGGGQLSELEVLNLSIEVVEGLAAAHSIGLIHRDIKPANILLNEQSKAKLVDFGLALMFEVDRDESEEMWATPYYVPPEKLRGEQEDFRGDIYSFGATLYHLLAGRPPHDNDSVSISELLEAKSVKVHLGDAAPLVSVPTQKVVNRMMETDPGDRYDSYEALLEDMVDARDKLRAALGLSKEKGITGGAGRSQSRRDVKVVAGISFAVLAAFVVVVLVAMLGRDTGQDTGANLQVPVQGIDRDDIDVAGLGRVGEQFVQAREALMAGNFAEAASVSGRIVADSDAPATLAGWAAYKQMFALLLNDQPGAARKVADSLFNDPRFSGRAAGRNARMFGRMVRWMSDPWPIDSSEADELSVFPEDCALALLIGLKNWQHGRFDSALHFWEVADQMMASANEEVEWLASCRARLSSMRRDAELIAQLELGGIAEVDQPEELKSIVESMEGVLENLQSDERSHQWLAAVVADESRRVEELHEARQRAAERERERLRDEEFAMLDEHFIEVGMLAAGYRYESVIEKLQALEVNSDEAFRRLQLAISYWQDVHECFNLFLEDLNEHGYRGRLHLQGNQTLFNVEVLRVTATTLVIDRPGGAETIQLSRVSAAGIMEMIDSVWSGLKDGADSERRRLLVYLLHAIGEEEKAESMARTVTRDFPAFADEFGSAVAAVHVEVEEEGEEGEEGEGAED